MVKLRVAKTDDKGRFVAAGSKGCIVHVYPVPAHGPPAYIVEISMLDGRGIASDAHLFDALHSELEAVVE